MSDLRSEPSVRGGVENPVRERVLRRGTRAEGLSKIHSP
jgi:hypothetical protein